MGNKGYETTLYVTYDCQIINTYTYVLLLSRNDFQNSIFQILKLLQTVSQVTPNTYLIMERTLCGSFPSFY